MGQFADYMKGQADKRTKSAQAQITQIKEVWKNKPLRYPQFSTGARTFIQVGGKPLTMAMEFNYSVTAEVEEIRTIDTSFPWDISVGQVKVSGTLKKIVHPETSAEAEGLFHTMQSIIHQPYVEILVQDADGSAPFFARGMFTAIQAGFARGQITVQSVTFTGVAYQHWAHQDFIPYSDGGILGGLLSGVKNFTSGLSKFGL